MKTNLFILLFLAFSVINAAYASDACNVKRALQEIFTIEPHLGEEISKEEIFNFLPYRKLDYSVRQLGGNAGGKVYKIIPTKIGDHSFVVKFMKPEAAANDLAAFDLLREAMSAKSLIESNVKIVRAKVLPQKSAYFKPMKGPVSVMQLEAVEGRSLFSILSDPLAPTAVKDQLRHQYNQFLDQLEQYFSVKGSIFTREKAASRYFFVDSKNVEERLAHSYAVDLQPDVGTVFVPRTSNKSTGILIKSDNFIVTRKFDLYLIDPI